MAKEFTRRIKEELIYIPIGCLQDEEPLTFKFIPLNNVEIARVDDRLSAYDISNGNIITATSELNLQLSKERLISWENLKVDGEKVDFSISLLDDINIVDELVELGRYIYTVSKYPDTKIEY